MNLILQGRISVVTLCRIDLLINTQEDAAGNACLHLVGASFLDDEGTKY